jgi:hypothetical protein
MSFFLSASFLAPIFSSCGNYMCTRLKKGLIPLSFLSFFLIFLSVKKAALSLEPVQSAEGRARAPQRALHLHLWAHG